MSISLILNLHLPTIAYKDSLIAMFFSKGCIDERALTESGRSRIKMLGVFLIIGVLSVCGM